MKVLMVGSGAREHAIAWKLLKDDPSLEIICAPGNAGISELGQCVPLKITDINGLASFALRAKIDLTVVGPEGPVADGIVHALLSTDGTHGRLQVRIDYPSDVPFPAEYHQVEGIDAEFAEAQLALPQDVSLQWWRQAEIDKTHVYRAVVDGEEVFVAKRLGVTGSYFMATSVVPVDRKLSVWQPAFDKEVVPSNGLSSVSLFQGSWKVGT
jgi:hypothetical protein